jgi:type III pantothenate kinase
MQAGILYGYVGQVEGIVSRMKAKSSIPPKVIATGGLASLIASESDVIDIVDPFLTLTGLKILYEKNADKKQ